MTLPTPRDTVMLRVLGPGEGFGELALVDAEPRSATVVALGEGRTWSIHKIDFDGLMRRHAGVSRVLLAVLANDVRTLSTRVAEALYTPAPLSIRRRLCELATIFGEAGAEPVIPLTQETIAQLAGTSRPGERGARGGGHQGRR